METATDVEANTSREVGTDVRERPVRRAIARRDRAPITVDTDPRCLGSAVLLPGRPQQATVLRHHLHTTASQPSRETAVLESLASELFNNALTHSRSGEPGGEVTVSISTRRERIQVKVTDQGPRDERAATPHLRPWNPDAEGGFGLRMVAAEADRWGTFHEDGRTTVWFEIDRPGERM